MGPQPTQGNPGPPPAPTPLNPAGPQDTDDDRHGSCHLSNLFVRLHYLLDPRLGRRLRARTPRLNPRKGCWGERGAIPGERGRGAPTEGEHRRGRGVRGPEPRAAPAPQRGLGPSLPGAGPSPHGPDHVLTGGNRALYFFFLLGISGILSPRRAQRRRPQPPGPGPARRPPAEVPPGPGAARSVPAAPHWVLAPPVGTPLSGPSALPRSLPGGARQSRAAPPLPPVPGQKSER